MPSMTYLHMRGTLAENMVYRPRPGHESSRPGRRVEGDSAYQLVLLDSEGRTLLKVAPQVNPSGCGNAYDPLRYRVRGVLPLHPNGVAYELRRGELLLYRTAIPVAPPTLVAPRTHKSANGVTINWQHCELAPQELPPCVERTPTPPDNTWFSTPRVTYSVVAAMESGRRITVARGLTALAHSVDLSVMPVHGKGTLYLVASDGIRSSEVEAGSIEVPQRPPSIHILSPDADARIPYGQVVSVLGCCLDMGGQPVSPERTAWSIDGERFAAGTVVAAVENLTPGRHRLTLALEDENGQRVETGLTFSVEEPDEHFQRWQALMTEHVAVD
jgi:hypothetical protein